MRIEYRKKIYFPNNMESFQFIYLCGGLGKHKYSTSMHSKPLNHIYGKPLFTYTLKSFLNLTNHIYIIYNDILHEQNLHGEIHKKFPHLKTTFYKLPYITRGPLESAYLAIKNLPLEHKPILFFDNDVIYTLQKEDFQNINFPFIGYYHEENLTNRSNQYCYIKQENNTLTQIQEKDIISNDIGIGIYGFSSPNEFIHYSKNIILNNQLNKNEFFFSNLFQTLLSQTPITTHKFTKPLIIGSNEQVINVFSQNPQLIPKLRLCFDLDNTLVTYPIIPDDYTTCQPIHDRIDFLKRCKELGHTIIIHTARRMRTHKGSIGRVIADIGLTTIEQLNKFDIPYDELLFGKPEADFYIDDKAINHYIPEWKHWMGFFDEKIHSKIINQLPTNNLNQIIKINDERIHKKGPSSFLNAQAHYLMKIKKINTISPMFPTLYACHEDGDFTVIDMEYLQGIPIYKIYQEGLLTPRIIDQILTKMNEIHNFHIERNISQEEQMRLVKSNWITKLEKRLELPIYQLIPNIQKISHTILTHVKNYTENMKYENIRSVIHGDFWFSNIIYTFQHEPKFIDPRGKLENLECLFGDKYYDYAKFYQSILGYDCIINKKKLPENYIEIKEYAHFYFTKMGIDINQLNWLTKSLILGTVPFIEGFDENIAESITKIINSSL